MQADDKPGTDARFRKGSLHEESPLYAVTPYTPYFRRFSVIAAWICLLLTAIEFGDGASEWLGSAARHVHPPFLPPHQTLPALLTFLLTSLAVLGSRDKNPMGRWLQAVCGALILAIGLFCSLHGPPAFCQLDTMGGWMVLLTGFAVGAGSSRLPMIGYVRQVSLFVLFFLCGLTLLAQIYRGAGEVLGLSTPWSTALTGFVAAHAMLFQFPGFGVMRLLSGDGFGCHIMRRLLPSVIILLVTLGWILATGESLGWYPQSFGESLYAVLSITGFSGILLFTAASLNRIDAERRERESELRRGQLQLQAILDHASAIICLKDLSGKYLLVNQSFARIAGVASPAACLGKSAADLFPEETALEAEESYHALLVERRGIEKVSRFVLADGTTRHLLTARFPLLDADGLPYALCGIYTDITEIKRQEEEIHRLNASLREKTERQEAANRELEAFSYSVSHDLRAPLRHIAGFGQLLAQRSAAALDDKSRHYLDVIQISVSRMGALIDDLLAFSRANKVGLSAQRVRAGDMVREIRAELESMRKGPDVSWRIGELPDMRGDPAMLRQVWVNLLSNALKYSGKNPEPRIEVGFLPSPGGAGAYFVRDNGAGFDMRYADKLFGVFQRLHSAQEYEGTGIGLAMVRRILERHGGRIWAHATPDEGATFYFVLPEHEPATSTPSVVEGAAS